MVESDFTVIMSPLLTKVPPGQKLICARAGACRDWTLDPPTPRDLSCASEKIRIMKTPLNKILLVLTSTLVLAGIGATSRGADVYKVDSVHSSIVFRIKHLGVVNVYGRFNEISGTVIFDKENPSKTALDFSVPVESIDTHVPKRDQHLKSPDFFNAKEFPVITFKSKEVKKTDADTYQITGDLTLHGVTKSLAIDFKKGGEAKGMQNEFRSGGETQFTIKRSDYGMNFMLNGVGDEVTVMVAVEGVRQ